MKKLFLTFTALVIACSLHAQDNSKSAAPAKVTPPTPPTPPAEVKQSTTNDYLVRKGGKIYFFENNKLAPLDKEVTLQNGTKVTPSGECTAKDGAKSTMREGDFLYMNGAMKHTMKEMKKD